MVKAASGRFRHRPGKAPARVTTRAWTIEIAQQDRVDVRRDSDRSSLFTGSGVHARNPLTGSVELLLYRDDAKPSLRCSPDLARPIESRDYFAPSNWRDLDRRDLDLGGTAAIPFDVVGPNGTRKLIFAIGKTGERPVFSIATTSAASATAHSARVTTRERRHHVAGHLERR